MKRGGGGEPCDVNQAPPVEQHLGDCRVKAVGLG